MRSMSSSRGSPVRPNACDAVLAPKKVADEVGIFFERIGHRRRAAEVSGEGRNRSLPLCGILISYQDLGPEPSGLSPEYKVEAVV